MSAENQAGGRLTTHVLDVAAGRPAAGVKIDLYRIDDGERTHVTGAVTNADGRCDKPLLAGGGFRTGEYEIVFHVGEYFAGGTDAGGDPAFLGAVPVRAGLSDAAGHYHIPLLVSPYGYTTYRGS